MAFMFNYIKNRLKKDLYNTRESKEESMTEFQVGDRIKTIKSVDTLKSKIPKNSKGYIMAIQGNYILVEFDMVPNFARLFCDNAQEYITKINESEKKDHDIPPLKLEELYIGQKVYKDGDPKAKGIIRRITGGLHPHVGIEMFDTIVHMWFNDESLYSQPIKKRFDFSDLETVKQLHYELWDWLEKNPDKEKHDWPRWKMNGGDVPRVENLCFYCEYVSKHNLSCEGCPGDWKVEKYRNSPCIDSVYGAFVETGNLTVRECLARVIKNI